MPKVDKSQYTKSEWIKIRNERRAEKDEARRLKEIESSLKHRTIESGAHSDISFVIGNGTSRRPIQIPDLQKYGKIYGCNALYRTFTPDHLIAVDVKMILEINKSGYQNRGEVWTNPNKSFHHIKKLNFFHPSKGWSSGPTALWLASQHGYKTIYILGFDFRGINDGKSFNNMYADTNNYKKSTDGATFFGNWMRQTRTVFQQHPQIKYVRVIQPDNYVPEELNKFNNVEHIFIEDFKKLFNLQ